MTKAQANVTPQPKFATLAMSAAGLTKNIASIRTKSKALDQLIHKTAMAAFITSLPEPMLGNLNGTPARNLVAALSAGQSRLRLTAWFEHFTNLRITGKKDAQGVMQWAVKLLKPSDTGYREIDENMVIAANNKPYYDLHEEKAPVPLVIDSKMFAKLQAVLMAKLDEAKATGNLKVTPAELAEIEQLRKLASKADARAKGVTAPKKPKAVDPLNITAKAA